MKKKKSVFSRIVSILLKIGVAIGTVVAFYKLPGIIADKISYRQLKKRDFNQK
jgi:hypothetical protein